MKAQPRNDIRKTIAQFALTALLFAVLALFGCGGGGSSGGGGGDGSSTGNTAPIAEDGTLVTDEDTAATGFMTATDADGDSLTYTIGTNGTKGTAVITDVATGAYTYTPSAEESGADSFTFTVNDGTEDSNEATITITIDPVNDDPVADAGSDQTADEQTSVELDGSGSTDIDGTVSYAWSQTGGPTVTLSDETVQKPTFTAPAVAVVTDLTFSLTVTDDGGLDDTDEVSITVNNSGSLVGSIDTPPASVNLTDEGTTDWIHWGFAAADSFVQRNGSTERIGDYADFGTVNAQRIPDDSPVAFTWTNGEGGSAETDVRAGLYSIYAAGNDPLTDGYELSLTPTQGEKTLKIYVGAYDGAGKVTATLPGSDEYGVLVESPGEVPVVRVITLNFSAATDGDELNIKYTVENNPENSNITLLAATLADAIVATPTISPSNGTFAGSQLVEITTATPGAEIRYTDNDTAVASDSTLYTGPINLTTNGETVIRAKAFFPGYITSAEAEARFTIVGAGNTILSAFIGVPPAGVNLTDEGTTDWIHWGFAAADSFVQRNGSTERIGDYADFGTVNAQRIPDDSPVAFTWTNGEGGSAETDVTTGVYSVYAAGNDPLTDGYELSLTPTEGEKTLKIYVGAFNGAGKLTATLPGSDEYGVLVESPGDIPIVRVVTLDFSVATDGDELNIKYTVENNPQNSNITLHAASLE